MTYPIPPQNQPPYGQPFAPPPPPKKSATGKYVGFGCAGVTALVLFAGCVAAVSGSGDTSAKDSTPPAAPASSAPVTSASAEALPECRKWAEGQVTRGNESPDAVTPPEACAGLSEAETDQMFEDILNDRIAEAATADAPKEEAVEEYGDGDYEVGVDIQPGTYVSTGATEGLFEFCSASTDPTDGSFGELESAGADERIILKVSANSGVVSISGCEPFVLRK